MSLIILNATATVSSGALTVLKDCVAYIEASRNDDFEYHLFTAADGFDWRSYKVYYEDLISLNIIQAFKYNSLHGNFEFLFWLITFIVSKISSDYQLLVVILSTMSMIFYYNIFKKIFGRYALVVLASFCIMYGNRLFISTLRQNIAVVFCFYFYHYFNKTKKAYILLLIAFFFHRTSIIIFPVVVLYKWLDKKTYILLTIIFTLLAFVKFDFMEIILNAVDRISGNDVFIYKLIYYGTAMSVASNFSFFDIFYSLLFLFLTIKSREITIFHTISFVFCFFNLLFPNTTILIFRLRYFLSLGFIYLLFNGLRLKENVNFIKIISLYLFCFLFYGKIYTFQSTVGHMVPYDNYIWAKIERPYDDVYLMNDRRWLP